MMPPVKKRIYDINRGAADWVEQHTSKYSVYSLAARADT